MYRLWTLPLVILIFFNLFESYTTDTCPKNEYQCANGDCIPMAWHCNGNNDCGDHSDENNCCRFTYNGFACANGRCIHMSRHCDGHNDCDDNSDENCPLCLELRCANDNCVPKAYRCDGTDDCGDNTDEENCPKCPDGEFACSNYNCIGMLLTCDGDDDCGDKSDEKNCDENLRCHKFGVCSQLCNNTEEGFTCSCFDGYYIDPSNNRSCKAELGRGSLLLVNAYDIRRFDVETKQSTSIVEGTTNAIAVDYDFKKKLVVWSDVTEKCIYSADIETGKSKKVIVKDKIRHPGGLAVDWIYGNVYWTDTELYGSGKSINVASLDGKLIKSLIETNLTNPFALVIDPLEGWMFWTDVVNKGKETRGRIEKAGMDGSWRKTIASKYTHQPNGLTIDVMSKKLYWVEAEKASLLISDYDGVNVKVIRSSIANSWFPLSIDVFEDSLYYVSLSYNEIYEADKFTGGTRRKIAWDLSTLKGIRVYHSNKQPTGPNYCAEKNGGCSHLCLPARNSTYACACPDDMELSKDQQNCRKTTRRVWTTTPSTLSWEIYYKRRKYIKTTTTTTTTTSILTTQTPSENITQETIFINETQPDAVAKMDHSKILTHTVIGVTVIGSVIGFTFVISAVSYFIYKQHSKENINTMHFENPVYQ